MEIDTMGPHCYNCEQFVHITNKCMKPKQEKGTCFECGKKDHMIKDCPIHKKKLATKKPGQKHLFGHSTHQENIGTEDSPTDTSNEGDANKEIKPKKICILAKETSECHTHLFH